HEPEHETVEQRRQLIFVQQFVRGAEQRNERYGHALAAVMEDALVDNGQQSIQDRRIRLEDFVEKGDVRFRELVVSDSAIVILFEAPQADRPENLFGGAEFGEQPLEIIGALDAAAELIRQHRFGRTRRPDYEHMAGRQQRTQGAVDEVRALQKQVVQ